MYFSFANIIY